MVLSRTVQSGKKKKGIGGSYHECSEKPWAKTSQHRAADGRAGESTAQAEAVWEKAETARSLSRGPWKGTRKGTHALVRPIWVIAKIA